MSTASAALKAGQGRGLLRVLPCWKPFPGLLVVLCALWTPGEILGQAPSQPETATFIDGWVEGVQLEDHWGERVVLQSLTGWGQNDPLRSRILGSSLSAGMGHFSDRATHYEEIIRGMVLQVGLGELDRLELLAQADAEVSDRRTMEWLEALLLAGELSLTTVEALNRYGVLDRPISAMASASDAMRVSAPFSSATELSTGLANVEHALNAFGAVVGAISMGQDMLARIQAAILWRALEVDLALRRVESLSRESTLADQAFQEAIARVREDLESVPASLWEEMYRAAVNDPSALAGTALGAAGLGLKLAQMAGASSKMMPWIGAVLFTGRQFQLAGEHRRDLQRMTAAATIHHSLRDAPAEGLSLENREALQLLFLEHRREAFANWTYTVVYRGVSRGWRELLDEFEEDSRSYLVLVTERRVQALLREPFDGRVLPARTSVLLDWAPGDTVARPMALRDAEGAWIDPWGSPTPMGSGYCFAPSPPVSAFPLGEELEGYKLYRWGLPVSDSLSVRAVRDPRDGSRIGATGAPPRHGTGAFRPVESQSGRNPRPGRVLYAGDTRASATAVSVSLDAPLVQQSTEFLAARMIAQARERLQPRVEAALRLETPFGPRLLVELVAGLAPGVATTRDGYEARWVEDGWRLLTILSPPADGGGGLWTQEYEHLSEPMLADGSPRGEALIDLLDVTGDGWLEVLLEESGYLWRGYKILQFEGPGSWRTMYTGGRHSSCS